MFDAIGHLLYWCTVKHIKIRAEILYGYKKHNSCITEIPFIARVVPLLWINLLSRSVSNRNRKPSVFLSSDYFYHFCVFTVHGRMIGGTCVLRMSVNLFVFTSILQTMTYPGLYKVQCSYLVMHISWAQSSQMISATTTF